MEHILGIGDNILCSDTEIEAFSSCTTNENVGSNNNDVIFKKELIFLDDDKLGFGASGSHRRSAVLEPAVAKPLEGLYEEGPAPFVKKTYAMVDDIQTDSIISWSESELSFVIWDHFKFSTDVLPKYFKHCNFSSFVRQLNTYGFKKVSPDRCEYANEGFQRGKEQFLKNIRRKRHQSDYKDSNNREGSQLPLCSGKPEKERELKNLERDTNYLRMELLNIQKQQESSDNELLSVKERLKITEHKQQQMLIYMAKAFKNQLFNEILMQQLRSKETADTSRVPKKQKLITPQCNESRVEPSTGWSQVQQDFAIIDLGFHELLASDESRSSVTVDLDMHKQVSSNEARSPVQGEKVDEVSATRNSGATSEKWENLSDDDVVSKTETAKIQANRQSKIVHELEELITNVSNNWDTAMKEMVEQVVGLQSQS